MRNSTRMLIAVCLGGAPLAAWAGPYEDGNTAYQRKDYVEALRLFGIAAGQGNALAQANLGVMYHNGEGVAQDYAEALRWFRLAAAQGDARAQSNLGIMYERGEGVAKDNAEALRWYRLAAAQGRDDAAKAVARLTPGK